MKKLIQYSLTQPLFIVLGTILFIMAGVIAFKNLSVEAFPDVTDTQVTVIALFPGRAAEEVEKQVTLPIESALAGLPNSIRVFSHTQFGLSFTVVTYDDKSEVNLVRAQVAERLRGIDLPPGVETNIAPNATPVGETGFQRPNCVRWKTGWLNARCARCPAWLTWWPWAGTSSNTKCNLIWTSCAPSS
jgi:cobalt-zinc-cadmium resistance protein CzcA